MTSARGDSAGPYRPFGPYDYQRLPASPALHVRWDRSRSMTLERLVDTARNAGWQIHGADLIAAQDPDWPTVDAMIILERGSEDRFVAFQEWLRVQPGVEIAGVSRDGTEKYST